MEYILINDINPFYSTIEQILINRGIPPEKIVDYLQTTDAEIIPPTQIANIHEAAILLTKHIYKNSKVMLQIDSDCDGYTSAAIFMNYLYKHFPTFVTNNIKYRVHSGKQHGIIPSSIDNDINLVIALDASSNDYDEHKILADRGIDVLVIDHHNAAKISEYACVVNNQLCEYPNKTLCGAGMVYKFCCYFDTLMETEYADLFLDLAALGLIADMMDLRNFETKHIIKKGLENIRNPFLSAMIQKNSFSIGEDVTPIGLAFYVAPFINAITRMGTEQEKLLLFESMLDFRALEELPSTKRGCKGQLETRVEQSCRNCTNIKNQQTKARDNYLGLVEKVIQDKNLLENKILIIPINTDATDRNITGLVANQLMSKYQRPVLLLHKVVRTDDLNNTKITWEGSGRGYDKSKFNNLQGFLLETNLVEYAEGHHNALGVGITDTHLPQLIEYSNKKLQNIDFSPVYRVDYLFASEDFNAKCILDIAQYSSLWGQNIEEPFIAIEGLKITGKNITLMSRDKNPTLRISLKNGVSLIKFKSSEEEFEKLYSDLGCVVINVVGCCAKNEWRGTVTPQLIIKDYEIVSQQEYYF